MRSYIKLSNFQFIIFYIFYKFVNLNALIGHNILNATEPEFSSVACITINQTLFDDRNIICTGTLISNQHILTAAHCFYNVQQSSINVILGSIIISAGTKYYIMWWITYNQWTTQMRLHMEFPSNDIAVAKLLRTTRNQIIPATLSITPNIRMYRLKVQIAGCGLSNDNISPQTIQTAKLKIIKKIECEAIAMRLLGHREIIEERYLCTIANPYTLLSSGDSGGPLFFRNIILGINVGNYPSLNGSFNENKANYHISVNYYLYFIENTLSM